MMRAFAGEALFFFLPFIAFALYLVALKRNPLAWAAWSDMTLWLVIGGLVLVVVALLFTGAVADREQGAFRPTHVENGRVVPGEFR
jgi:steroid 5-alpha reductase family enzyme